MSQNRTQIPYLHILRTIAILMVIMLHSVSPYISNPTYFKTSSWYVYLFLNAVSRGGVPLFFMISGYLLLSEKSSGDFKAFYKKRLPRLIIPLLCWNVLYYIFRCEFDSNGYSFGEFFSQLINLGTSYHLWYIYTLIGIYLLAPFIKKIVDSCDLKQVFWLVVLICLCPTIRPFINTVTPLYIYLFDPLFNGYVGFFVLGYVLGKKEFSLNQTFAIALLGIVAVILCMSINHISSSDTNIDLTFNTGYNICFYAVGCAFFCTFKKINIKNERVISVLKHFSKVTFGMYFVHAAIMEVISKYFMIDASPVVCTFYLFVLTVPVSYVLSLVVGKIKYLT